MNARSERPAYGALLAAAAALLLTLPFVTTFDDVLTAGAMRIGLSGVIEAIVPYQARMVAAVLSFFGVPAAAHDGQVVLYAGASSQALFLSWNCLGWQSLVLFGISLLSGLRGDQRLDARVQLVMIGLLGTVLVNLARISAVCLVAAKAGRVPALLFHDYGGTLLTVAWLFALWALAYRWILAELEWSEA